MAICRKILVTFALFCASPSLLLWAYNIRHSSSDGQVLPSNMEEGERPMQLPTPMPEPSAIILRQAYRRRGYGRRNPLRTHACPLMHKAEEESIESTLGPCDLDADLRYDHTKLELLHGTILTVLQNAFAQGDSNSLDNEGAPPPKVPAERISRDSGQAYLAVCLCVRDQGQDLREWIEYHQRVGIGKFYIFDDNSLLSSVPAAEGIEDLVQEGLVECEAVGPMPDNFTKPQMFVYDKCIQRYRANHQWMAFIDVDEFLVIRDAAVASLPQLLLDYTDYGALTVNWQLFGASGHERTPEGSTLASYTACYPEHDPENLHVKAIVNLDFVYQTAGDPHSFRYYEGKTAINSAGEKVSGPKTLRVVTDSIVLNHYVTKSLEQYQQKIERGSGMRNRKDLLFFAIVQLRATANCTYAVHLGEQQQTLPV